MIFSKTEAQNISIKNATEGSINYHFNNSQISVYQKSSAEKFAQFAEYFNLYQKTQDKDLQEQLEQNIFNLFINSDVQIADFIGENGNLTLQKFIRKYKNSGLQIDIISQKSSSDISFDFWLNFYEIEIEGKKISIKQKVYFQKINKKFGNKTKEIWEIKLGEIYFK
jgi:hypothetical protein